MPERTKPSNRRSWTRWAAAAVLLLPAMYVAILNAADELQFPGESVFGAFEQVAAFDDNATGACCTNGPGTETECIITTALDCETNHSLFLGPDTDCDGIECEPLAVTMDSMSAEMTARGVRISWTTAMEIDTIGFRILRATGGSRTKTLDVISSVIPSSGAALGGASYRFLDNSKEAELALYYVIEDIDIYGKATSHGRIEIERDGRPGGGRTAPSR